MKKGVDGTSSWAGGVFGKVNIAKNGTVYIKDCGNSGSIYSEMVRVTEMLTFLEELELHWRM